MHLVDRDRLTPLVGFAPVLEVGFVFPFLQSSGVVTEAVFGRSSLRLANGSAFSGSSVPFWPTISNL
jgi:hypothetical protein